MQSGLNIEPDEPPVAGGFGGFPGTVNLSGGLVPPLVLPPVPVLPPEPDLAGAAGAAAPPVKIDQ